MRPEPHKLHLAAMRRAIADVRLAAGEIDTRAWLATVPHLAPPPSAAARSRSSRPVPSATSRRSPAPRWRPS